MATEFDIRAFAESFCRRCTEGSVEDVLDMYAEDAVIEVIANPDYFPVPLPTNKGELAEFLKAGRSKGTIELTCDNYLIDGNKVAVEAVGTSQVSADYLYQNRYVFVMEMRDGKIAHTREYMDTLYAKHAFERMAGAAQ